MGWFGKSKPQLPSESGEPHTGLPDSTINEGLCPHCGNQSAFEIGDSIGLLGTEMTDGYKAHVEWHDRATVLTCRHCKNGVLVVEEQFVGDHSTRGGIKESGEAYYKGKHWWPAPAITVDASVPRSVADTFAEAVACNHARCYRASVVMSRRTLEAVCTEQGHVKGDLNTRLLSLEGSGQLHKTLADWCHEVRTTGNAGAHFDPASSVDKRDSDALIGFIEELLKYLYDLPTTLLDRRANP